MTLITEDGTGLEDAESFASVEDADGYFELRPATTAAIWDALSDTEKEVALRMGTQYIEARYRDLWVGARVQSYQALAWPRLGGVDSDGFAILSDTVPSPVKDATCELALRSGQGESLLPDVSDAGALTAKSVTVGSIAISKTYESGKPLLKQYTLVEYLLRPLLTRRERAYRG